MNLATGQRYRSVMSTEEPTRHLSVRAFSRLAKMDRSVVAAAVKAGTLPEPAMGTWTAPSGRVLLIVPAAWVLNAEAALRRESESGRA